jgi:hypothetical protein
MSMKEIFMLDKQSDIVEHQIMVDKGNTYL